MAQRSLRGLGAPALAPCHLAKQKDPDTHSNWSQQEANSVPILPQSASRHDAGGRNPHSNHLCRSTVRFGSKNRLQRSRKRGPRDAGALRISFSLILGLAWYATRHITCEPVNQVIPGVFISPHPFSKLSPALLSAEFNRERFKRIRHCINEKQIAGCEETTMMCADLSPEIKRKLPSARFRSTTLHRVSFFSASMRCTFQ